MVKPAVLSVYGAAVLAAVGCSAPRPRTLQMQTLTDDRPTPVSAVDPARERDAACSSAPEPTTNASDPADYAEVAGFAVHLTPLAQRHPRASEALAALQVYLADLLTSFPTAARNRLRTISVWLTERSPSPPTFHPDVDYLRAHGLDPELAKAIEIPSIDVLIGLLREGHRGLFGDLLAAGYFVRLRPPPWSELQETFEAAKKANRSTASFRPDALAYFAALSAAYFGRSDLPPDRALLRAADPRGTALVARLWPLDAPPPKPSAAESEAQTMSGFAVIVEKRALAHADTKLVLAFLSSKLAELTRMLPVHSLPVLRRFPIVVRWDACPEENAELYFHDSFVDVLNARAFLAARTTSPYALLHELAHGYEGAVPGLRHKVESAFAKAKASKSYDNVAHKNGGRGRAYAMTNASEYFAELSKAYLASSEWFPFTRADLERHDPDGFRLMEAWTANEPTGREGSPNPSP